MFRPAVDAADAAESRVTVQTNSPGGCRHLACLTNSTKQTFFSQNPEVKVSKYADNLVQIPAENKISGNSADWKCEIHGMCFLVMRDPH